MKPNIIWISSYPKSGNTMVRLFLSAYFFTQDGKLNNFDPLKKITNFSDIRLFNKIDNFPNISFDISLSIFPNNSLCEIFF